MEFYAELPQPTGNGNEYVCATVSGLFVGRKIHFVYNQIFLGSFWFNIHDNPNCTNRFGLCSLFTVAVNAGFCISRYIF